MWLYTAQGTTVQKNRQSTADTTGLTSHLGFRPLFCSYFNINSLSDTWFRIWSASPRYIDEIWLMEVEEDDAIPMDVITWTESYLPNKGKGDTVDFSAVLNTEFRESTDYIVRPDVSPRKIYKYSLFDIINANYDSWSLPDNERLSWLSVTKNLRDLSETASLGVTAGRQMGSVLTAEAWYGILRLTGFVPLLWSNVTGHKNSRFANAFCMHSTDDIIRSDEFQEAQNLMDQWDDSTDGSRQFGFDSFIRMRDLFCAAVDQHGHSFVESVAKINKIGRNDYCFCGSGRKYKKCHQVMHVDEMMLNPPD